MEVDRIEVNPMPPPEPARPETPPEAPPEPARAPEPRAATDEDTAQNVDVFA